MSRFPTQIQGILWMVITGFLAVCIYAMALHLNKTYDFHPFQIVFFYNIAGLLFYMPWVLRKHITLQTRQLRLFGLRGVLEFAGFSLSIAGLTQLPLPVHTALSFTSPLFGSLAAVILLRECSSIHRWLSLALGFIGVLMVSRPGVTAFDGPALLVLGGAMCFAFCGITIKKLTATEPHGRIAVYMMIMTAIVSAPFAFMQWQSVGAEVIPYLLLLGLMVALVQFTVALAYSKADVTVILPFNFLNLVWSSVIAFIAFDQLVDRWTIMGGTVILMAAVYGLHFASRTAISATTRAAAGGS